MALWLIYIAACIAYNWFKIVKRGVHPTYFNSNWARFIFGLMFVVWMNRDVYDSHEWWWRAIPLTTFAASSFYLLFDPVLNLLRGKPVLYRGKTSGYLDKLGTPYYVTLKVFCLIILILSIWNFWGNLRLD